MTTTTLTVASFRQNQKRKNIFNQQTKIPRKIRRQKDRQTSFQVKEYKYY